MKISILGAGAMGMLFGAYLSRRNQVWLVDVDEGRVNRIRSDGVAVREKDGSEGHFFPQAVTDTAALGKMDLVIVFVKSMYTLSALESNRRLLGKDTYLMTLQNGAGHEEKLLRFTDPEHVIIGTTQHNASVLGDGYTFHGGSGHTSIGSSGSGGQGLGEIAEEFTRCGIECSVCDDVKKQIWMKLFTNASASALTAVLQVPLGYIYDDPDARAAMHALCREAVEVANAEGGARFDVPEAIESVENVCKGSGGGYTSIYADIKNGRRTEVDSISGAVVDTAKRLGVPAPCHEMIVRLIHAMERRP